MTDGERRRLHSLLSDDPSEREAAIADEEALLQEWPPADDELSNLQRGMALWKIGEALFRSRRMKKAAERLDEAERCLSCVRDTETMQAGTLSTRAGALFVLERYSEARAVAARAIQLALKADVQEYLRTGLSVRALSSKALGEWREASFAADELLSSIGADPPAKHRSVVTRALITKAWAARMAGQAGTGLTLVEQAVDRAREDGNGEVLCEALGERAELLYSAGRTAAAIQSYEELIASYREMSEDYARVDGG